MSEALGEAKKGMQLPVGLRVDTFVVAAGEEVASAK